MSKPYLIFLCGIAGSGKSYFAERLAKEFPAIWIGADGVRSSMFEDAHALANMTDQNNKQVFSSIDYFTGQALSYGAHVIHEAFNGQEWVRTRLRDFAISHSAIPVQVLVETPIDIAFERATTRQPGTHAWTMSPERHKSNVARFEPLIDKTNLITIDGTMPFDEQFKSFQSQLAQIKI